MPEDIESITSYNGRVASRSIDSLTYILTAHRHLLVVQSPQSSKNNVHLAQRGSLCFNRHADHTRNHSLAIFATCLICRSMNQSLCAAATGEYARPYPVAFSARWNPRSLPCITSEFWRYHISRENVMPPALRLQAVNHTKHMSDVHKATPDCRYMQPKACQRHDH